MVYNMLQRVTDWCIQMRQLCGVICDMAEGIKNKSVNNIMYTKGDIVHYKNDYTDKTGMVIDIQYYKTTLSPRIQVMFQEEGNPTYWFVVDKASEQYLTNLSH
jgi:hypothetical protein